MRTKSGLEVRDLCVDGGYIATIKKGQEPTPSSRNTTFDGIVSIPELGNMEIYMSWDYKGETTYKPLLRVDKRDVDLSLDLSSIDIDKLPIIDVTYCRMTTERLKLKYSMSVVPNELYKLIRKLSIRWREEKPNMEFNKLCGTRIR